jgi:hypothetical protein
LRELIFRNLLWRRASQTVGIQSAYRFKELRRGVFRRFFPHHHGAQTIFLRGNFQQRFKCARPVNAALCTETCCENWAIIYFCIVGKPQPVDRRAASAGAIAGIVTLGGEQLVAPGTAALARRFRRRSPHGHKRHSVRPAQAQNCLPSVVMARLYNRSEVAKAISGTPGTKAVQIRQQTMDDVAA